MSGLLIDGPTTFFTIESQAITTTCLRLPVRVDGYHAAALFAISLGGSTPTLSLSFSRDEGLPDCDDDSFTFLFFFLCFFNFLSFRRS